MGITLGINDDYWHGLIPLISYIVASLILSMLVTNEMVIKITWLCGTIVLFLVQFFNEYAQYKEAKEKGTDQLNAWKKNSRRDWGFFVLGSFIGTILFGLILGIF